MLVHFCLLGLIIHKSGTPSQASKIFNFSVARLIWVWDRIGPWSMKAMEAMFSLTTPRSARTV